MSTFPERLKILRKERGLTQEALAEAVGLSRSTIAGYEAASKLREPDFDVVRRLADFFGVSVDYLLGRTDDRNSPKKTKYSNAQIAAWRLDGYGELPPDVQKQLEDYLDYVFTKYGKKDPDKENGPDKTK